MTTDMTFTAHEACDGRPERQPQAASGDRAVRRGERYHELLDWPAWVRSLVAEAETAGVYTRGIATDRRGRGEAINVDVYGHDEPQGLAVVQVRQCRISKYGNSVRKDYFLLGHLESGEVFAHPIDSPLRSAAVRGGSPRDVVLWVQARLWSCSVDDLPHITRQGDVALVPALLPEGAELLPDQEILIADSHRVIAERIWRLGETYYCVRGDLRHVPGEHARVRQTRGGIRRIVVAPRASTWGFSAPTAD